MQHRFHHAIAQRLLQDLIVPKRLIVGVQEEVRMRVDQSRQQREAGEADGFGVAGCAHRARGANGGDAVALHEHDPARVRRFAARVEYAVGPKQHCVNRRGRHERRESRLGRKL